jgi:hypothetical protein
VSAGGSALHLQKVQLYSEWFHSVAGQFQTVIFSSKVISALSLESHFLGG